MTRISPEKVAAAAARGVANRQEASRREAMAALAPRTHQCEYEDYHNTYDGEVHIEVCGDPASLVIVDGSFGTVAVASCPEHLSAWVDPT
jgi:hypothetical protein